MASPRTYNIHIRKGNGNKLEWSYFDIQNDDYWNPVTESSPFLLLKINDDVNWIAGAGINSLDIEFTSPPRVFGPVSDNNSKNPRSKGKASMIAKELDKYVIKADIGTGSPITVDPKGGADDPPT